MPHEYADLGEYGAKVGTVFARLGTLKLDLVAQKKKEYANGRYRAITFEEGGADLSDLYCGYYVAKSEDRGVPDWPGSVFLLTVQEFICTDPEVGLLVAFSYSERLLKGEEVSALIDKEAKEFFDSIRFTGS